MNEILEALTLSVKVGLLATLLNLFPALGISVLLSRFSFRGRGLLEGIINLPLVMPPVTLGYLMLFLLGRNGVLGGFLYSLFGIRIAFTATAAVLASMTVAFPLTVRSIKTSLDMVDRRWERAALTLGAGPFDVFRRVTLPLIKPGILNGLILGFARSLGEFGATMTFAGNIKGVTRTIPLAVYSKLQIPGQEKEAALLVGFSILISMGAMIVSNYCEKKGKRAEEPQQTRGGVYVSAL